MSYQHCALQQAVTCDLSVAESKRNTIKHPISIKIQSVSHISGDQKYEGSTDIFILAMD